MTPVPSPVSLPARLAGPIHPLEALDRLEGLPGRVLLETVPPWRGRTLLAAAPRAVVRGRAGRGEFLSAPSITWPRAIGDPLQEDASPIGALSLLASVLDHSCGSRPAGQTVVAEGPPGAWVGFLGYELAGEIEPLPPRDPSGGLPDLWFGAYDWILCWPDGAGRPPILRGEALRGDRHPTGRRRRIEALFELLSEDRSDANSDRTRLLAEVEGDGVGGPGVPTASSAPGPGATGRRAWEAGGAGAPDPAASGTPLEGWPGVSTSLSRANHRDAVERIREFIRAGDIFQANLTCQLSAPVAPGASGRQGTRLYRALRDRSPSPYGAYLEADGVPIVSISPESFLVRDPLDAGDDRLVTSPIKGTRPRGATPERDRALAAELRASDKDAAENVMIVDLLRNDLSRVSKQNTVSVNRLLDLEAHPTVHHLVSEVEARLEPGTGWETILRALFPGGSITGAPKIRAMEILREVEPVARGPYTGAIGFVGFDRSASLSIAIRTAVIEGNLARYGAGGGITLRSEAAAEWDELIDKARAFLESTMETET